MLTGFCFLTTNVKTYAKKLEFFSPNILNSPTKKEDFLPKYLDVIYFDFGNLRF